MSKYIDICIQPIPKKNVKDYRKLTSIVGKALIKLGALASKDFVADDENATKLSFPKKIKLKKGEVLIFAVAEFKSKAHREKVFKAMMKDKSMEKLGEQPPYIDPKRAVVGGFTTLVSFEK